MAAQDAIAYLLKMGLVVRLVALAGGRKAQLQEVCDSVGVPLPNGNLMHLAGYQCEKRAWRQLPGNQIGCVRLQLLNHDGFDDVTVALVEFDEILSGFTSLGEDPDGTAQIAVEPSSHVLWGHAAQFERVSHVINSHILVIAILPWSSEDIRFVVLLGVVLIQPSGEHRHSPVDALTARTAMPLGLRLKHRVGTGAGQADKFSAVMASDQGDDFGLRLENEWIIHDEVSFEDRAE